ncbi:hypothetical protein ACFE04_015696 [Oxalis oulophora]
MSPKKFSSTLVLSILIAIFASTLFTNNNNNNNNNSTQNLIHKYLNRDLTLLLFTTSNSIIGIFFSLFNIKNLINNNSPLILRKKHHDDVDDSLTPICDDFPTDIPPPDTNTTTYLCVDRNGCCNFTTVQAAVDSITNISQKRTIIWINSGLY